MKQRFNEGQAGNCFFGRDKTGNEVECLVEQGQTLLPLEIKAGRTITRDYFKGMEYFARLAGEQAAKPCLIYGGGENQERTKARVRSWNSLDKLQL